MSRTWQSPHQLPPKSSRMRLCSRRAWAMATEMPVAALEVSEYRCGVGLKSPAWLWMDPGAANASMHSTVAAIKVGYVRDCEDIGATFMGAPQPKVRCHY